MVDISLTNTCTCNFLNKVHHTAEKVPVQEQKEKPKKIGHSYSEVTKRNSFFIRKFK